MKKLLSQLPLHIGLAVLLIGGSIIAIVADAVADPPAPADPRDYVGKDAPVEAGSLRFEDPELQRRWTALHTCIDARADVSWQKFPLRRIGNFVEEDTCIGKNAQRGCSGGNFRDSQASRWASVSTLHYPQSWPAVFGLNVDLGALPEADGIGVHLWWSEGGKTVVGSSVDVTFKEFAGGALAVQLSLGDTADWTLGESKLTVTAPGTRAEVLGRLLASPASLKAEGLRQLDALQARVREALQKGEVVRCVVGPYKGGGIPPRCERREPIPADEQPAELSKLDKHLGAQRDLLNRRSDALHAALVKLYPPACR